MNDFDEQEGFHLWEWLKSLFVRLDGPTFGAARSSQWSQVRRDFIKIHPECAVCGKKGTLLKPNAVHHCAPFHLHPDLELQTSNLIVVCQPHHLLVGHLMNWSSFNKDVRTDADAWLSKIQNRPK